MIRHFLTVVCLLLLPPLSAQDAEKGSPAPIEVNHRKFPNASSPTQVPNASSQRKFPGNMKEIH